MNIDLATILTKYKDQKPQKNSGDIIWERSYPVSAVISIVDEYAEQFKTKWIASNEQMPEPDSAFYLVSCGVKNITLIMWYGLHDNGENVWFYIDGMVKKHLLPHHWIPLPEAP